MELHSLKPAAGSIKKRKRIARGQGSGRGGTSTRGHKGQKSRSGYSSKRNFEGGQMPLQMRLPKHGFNNPGRKEYTVINVDRLALIATKFKLKEISPESLRNHGILKKSELLKILGQGELSIKLKVKAHAFSTSAKEKIESSGGSVTQL